MTSHWDPYPRGRRPVRPTLRSALRRNSRLAFLPVALIAAVLLLVAVIGILTRSDSADHAANIAEPSTPAAPAPALMHHQSSAVTGAPHSPGRSATRLLDRDLGETIISRLSGTAASAALLARIRAGQLGGVILFADNFAAGPTTAANTIRQLQHAAHVAGTWPLLIMTDQEGGEVRRLAAAPPNLAPRQMTGAQIAHSEGLATGSALRSIGVNVDLAPVADVEQIAGSFLAARSFGSSPQLVAQRACAFAQGLSETGVDYTLKHFPGLGTAPASTDTAPVTVPTAAVTLRANYAAYHRCGRGPRTLVMISSASYPSLTDNEIPALDAPEIYRKELHKARIEAVTISDDMQAGALANLEHPALHALRAGLDMLLYAQSEQASDEAYGKLDAALHDGRLPATRVQQAADAITRVKAALAK